MPIALFTMYFYECLNIDTLPGLTGTLNEPSLMSLHSKVTTTLSWYLRSNCLQASGPIDNRPHNNIFNVLSSSSSFPCVCFSRFPHTGENIYSYLNNHLSLMAASGPTVDLLGSSLHVWPDFHGNRSPVADPTLKGMVRGHGSRNVIVPHSPAEMERLLKTLRHFVLSLLKWEKKCLDSPGDFGASVVSMFSYTSEQLLPILQNKSIDNTVSDQLAEAVAFTKHQSHFGWIQIAKHLN